MAYLLGIMVIFIKGTIFKMKDKAMAKCTGQMGAIIRGSGKKVNMRAKVNLVLFRSVVYA